uniref:GH18 domain-containing protein n=1 Tax=Amphora coffeiformis TaxID=265554 RepID=A0A7S3L410_9STRA|eukprot:scaffold83_cov181-Amphora_coffeaeformis.AAC.22
MKRAFCLFLCWAVCLARRFAGELAVAGYLPDYRFYIDLNQTALYLTDLYLFSVQMNPTLGEMMLTGCCLGQDHLVKAKQAVAYKKEVSGRQLTLWLTIGGGGRSEGFQTLNGKEKYRQFVKAVELISKEYGIGGIDFDHEALRNHQDVVGFFRFIVAVAPALRKLGLSVSIAIHVGFSIPAQVYEAIDRINVMTYDYPFARLEEVTSSINTLIDSGIPSEKVFLGIPAYGRHQQHVGRVMTFAEIVDAAGTHVVERVQGPWNEFKFDPPSVVRQKVRLAKEKRLGGVFMWELGQDKQLNIFPGGILLEAMQSEAEKHTLLSDEL